MKTCGLLFVVVMATVVMTVASMEDEGDDWFEDLLQEYKRRPQPPPRGSSNNGKSMCLSYGKRCTITNRQSNCCRGLGCYAGSGNDCVGSRNCYCRKTPELKYVYYRV